ncbi:YadA-like family protein [Prochlorococcus sp. MIT 1307]|uniref:YadA-like family protein n=1 Tax=Prochlorococcus sp. MIT 1307 TaxID=3096219 RepID=UPI002A749F84|nr:YadA-like family protein [Prochlorococcus sp. MIT 1307]
MFIRKTYSSAIASAILLLGSGPAKAEWDLWGLIQGDGGNSLQIYTINSSTGINELRDTLTGSNLTYDNENTYINQITGDPTVFFDDGTLRSFNFDTSTWTIQSSNPTDYDGVYQRQLIRKNGNTYSIGQNSLNFEETSTKLRLWGTSGPEGSGNVVPIDITNGSKLLINGRDVEQAIDNVGALSAALTGLPNVPQDSPLSCGVGTGTHSANFAVSAGCASRINDRLAFNAAASVIPKNQEYQGIANDAWSGRLGFVFKIGKINKPAMLSVKEKKELQAKVGDLQSENQEMKASNAELRNLVAMQNERLEKLERIALVDSDEKEKYGLFFNLSNLFSGMKSFLISSK